MKLFDFVMLYSLIDNIANGGATVEDFGIDDEENHIYIKLSNSELFYIFSLAEKGGKNEN